MSLEGPDEQHDHGGREEQVEGRGGKEVRPMASRIEVAAHQSGGHSLVQRRATEQPAAVAVAIMSRPQPGPPERPGTARLAADQAVPGRCEQGHNDRVLRRCAQLR